MPPFSAPDPHARLGGSIFEGIAYRSSHLLRIEWFYILWARIHVPSRHVARATPALGSGISMAQTPEDPNDILWDGWACSADLCARSRTVGIIRVRRGGSKVCAREPIRNPACDLSSSRGTRHGIDLAQRIPEQLAPNSSGEGFLLLLSHPHRFHAGTLSQIRWAGHRSPGQGAPGTRDARLRRELQMRARPRFRGATAKRTALWVFEGLA